MADVAKRVRTGHGKTMSADGVSVEAMKFGRRRSMPHRIREDQAMSFTNVNAGRQVGLVTLLAVASWLSASAGGEPTRRRSSPPTRARPATAGTVMGSGIFEGNAFSLLAGPRPPTPQDQSPPLPPPKDAPPFDRDDLMQRLSKATAVIEDIASAPTKPIRSGSRVAEAIDELIAVSRQLAHDDPDYSSDVHYVRYADDLFAAARLLRSSLDRAAGPRADMALRSVRAACASCHGRFNP